MPVHRALDNIWWLHNRWRPWRTVWGSGGGARQLISSVEHEMHRASAAAAQSLALVLSARQSVSCARPRVFCAM